MCICTCTCIYNNYVHTYTMYVHNYMHMYICQKSMINGENFEGVLQFQHEYVY